MTRGNPVVRPIEEEAMYPEIVVTKSVALIAVGHRAVGHRARRA